MAHPPSPDAKNPSDLIPRLMTALVAIPLLLALIFYAPAEAFLALVLAAGSLSAWEYVRITCSNDLPALAWVVAALTAGAIAAQYFWGEQLLMALMASAVGLFVFMLFGYREQERATHHLGSALTALLYGGLMLGCFALMRREAGDESGPLFIVMMLGIIWGSDTGAYFVGKALGKHKLYPAVSPNKSIEGALGGVATSVLLTFGFNALFELTSSSWVALTPAEVLLLAIPGNVLGQLGDLCESLVKRAHGVKDSGTLIRGHGGMLDRIDALILASPWFYAFVHYIYAPSVSTAL